MKKVLFVLLLLFPFMVRAVENVKITSIEELGKSNGVTVNTEPKFEGLKINFDFKFTSLEDYVKYKVTIKNEDDQEYEIESGVSFSEGEYIKYEFGMNGDSAIIKPGESKEMTLQITYVNEPSPDKFVDGKYVEQNAMSIDLSTKDGQYSSVDPASLAKEDNPKTGSKGIILLIAVLLGALLLILFFEKKNAFFLIALFLLIPMTIYAIEKITIEIETKIEIEAKTKEGRLLHAACNPESISPIDFTFTQGIKYSEFAENPDCHTDNSTILNICVRGLASSTPLKAEFETCYANLGIPDSESMTVEEYQVAYEEYKNQVSECIRVNSLIDEENTQHTDFYLESKDNVVYYYYDGLC